MRTQREFFAALAKCRNGWAVVFAGGIRRIDEACPITAVAEEATGCYYSVDSYQDAAAAIGLPAKLANRIMDAADAGLDCVESRLRKRILAALGLEGATR